MTQSSLATSAAVSTPTPTPSAALSSDSPTETSSVASPPGDYSNSGTTVSHQDIRTAISIWDEVRLLLMVILAGTLGSLVHTVRSVYWYVGNRRLKWSWVVKYILQPFEGGALAMIFYVVVRGGFFSPQTTVQNTSPFGFAALAALVGLFSEQAVLKLKTVAKPFLSDQRQARMPRHKRKIQRVRQTTQQKQRHIAPHPPPNNFFSRDPAKLAGSSNLPVRMNCCHVSWTLAKRI